MPLQLQGLTITGKTQARYLAVSAENVLSKVDGKIYDLNMSDVRPSVEVEVWQGRLIVCAAYLPPPNGTTSALFSIDPDTDAIISMTGSGSETRFASTFLSLGEDRLYGLSNSTGAGGAYNLVAYTSATSTTADIVQASPQTFGFPGGLRQLDDGTFTWGHTNGTNAGTGIKQTTFPSGPVLSNVVNTPTHSGSYAVIENYNGTNLWVSGESNNASTIICYNVNSEDPINGTYTRFAPAILAGRDTNGGRASRTYSAIINTGNISWLIVNGVNKLAWTDDNGATSTIVDMPNGLYVCDLNFGDKESYGSVINDEGYFCATDNNAGTTGNNYLMRLKSDGTIEQVSQLPVPPGATVTLPGRLVIERDANGTPVDIGVPILFENGAGTKDLYMHRVPRNLWVRFPPGNDPLYSFVTSLTDFRNLTAGATTATDSVSGAIWTAQDQAVISSAQSKFGTSSAFATGTATDRWVADQAGIADLVGDDFCIEVWVYIDSTFAGGTNEYIIGPWEAEGTRSWTIILNTANQLNFLWTTDGNFNFSRFIRGNPGTLVDDEWTHIAVCRNGPTVTLYVNGVPDDDGTGNTNIGSEVIYSAGILPTILGSVGDNAYAKGHVDSYRITRGSPRYTTNFEPPASPFPRY